MNNKQIIKDILIEEFSNCNNFNYYIKIDKLNLFVNTKVLFRILIDNSSWFEGGIDSKRLFKQYENRFFYVSYNDIWSKFEKETKLKYLEIQSIVKDILEEGFKIKGITPQSYVPFKIMLFEEGFKIKGIASNRAVGTEYSLLEESFKLKGIFSIK